MRDIHRLAWELRPAALDDFGLEMALRRYADEWAALSGVPVDFHSQGMTARRLPPELETHPLPRHARGAHQRRPPCQSQTRQCPAQRRADHVSLIVEDDGQGFDAAETLAASATQGKLGLLGMQERATLAGGAVEIESSFGAGTTVFVRISLAPESPATEPAAASRAAGKTNFLRA